MAPNESENTGYDRRMGDRRKAQVPYEGMERRKANRRTGRDRRVTERRGSGI